MVSSNANLTDAEVKATVCHFLFYRSDLLCSARMLRQVHVVDLSTSDSEAAEAILHACVTTGFFYGMRRAYIAGANPFSLLHLLMLCSCQSWSARASH